MSIRRSLNRIFRPLIGHEIAKVEFGHDLWSDVETVQAAGEIKTVFDVGANAGQSARTFLRQFPQARSFSFVPTRAAIQRLARLAETPPGGNPANQDLGEIDLLNLDVPGFELAVLKEARELPAARKSPQPPTGSPAPPGMCREFGSPPAEPEPFVHVRIS